MPDIVRRLDELNGVMVQPSAESGSVTLFKIAAGDICDPVTLDFGKQAEAAIAGWSKPQSMESRITQALGGRRAAQAAQRAGMDGASGAAQALVLPHLKVGELFLAENGELPMRRVVRGVSRVFRGEKPAGDLSETAGDYWQFRAREAGIPDN